MPMVIWSERATCAVGTLASKFEAGIIAETPRARLGQPQDIGRKISPVGYLEEFNTKHDMPASGERRGRGLQELPEEPLDAVANNIFDARRVGVRKSCVDPPDARRLCSIGEPPP